jgi:Tol biopolymer transport system component
MPLDPGVRLGPYEIGARLGAGGMGEVYRARDTRLDRAVAIKVLPATLSLDADARTRLKREARALSQLSHPHICALYDVGEQGDTDFLVMELIDGETLASRLARSPLPIADTIRFGAQIADALERAHRAGIAHRDLKPGNVMLTPSGAKLLDFGLAKAMAPLFQHAPADGTTLMHSGLTAVGAVVGTIRYMAPEQIEGRPADARSDLFALGQVLFEMLTGRCAFEGSSAATIAAAILTVDPPSVCSLMPAVPAALDRLVRVCLEKNPDSRWQSAHDVAVVLRSIDVSARDGPPRSRARRLTAAIPWVLAAAGATAALAVWLRPSPALPPTALPVAFTVPPPAGRNFLAWVEGSGLALSPDGTRLAYIAVGGGIWIRPLAAVTATPLAGAEGANGVFWSPDGRSIGFFRAGVLNRIDAAGGPVVPLCDVLRWTGHTGTWGADGIVFASITGAAVFRVPTAGGAPVALLKPDAGRHETRLIHPHFLPDGRRFLYTAWLDDRTARLMLWEPGAPPREVMPVASNVEYVEPGYVLFVRESTLLARRFDPLTATVSGDPVAVTEPVQYTLIPGTAQFSSSRNGVVAYQSHSDQSRVAIFDRSGRELATVLKTARYNTIRLTPDDRYLLFDRGTAGIGTFDLWTLDLERGIENRMTSDAGNEIAGLWTPDRSTLVYSAGSYSAPRIRIRDLATGAERDLGRGGVTALQQADDVAPDRQSLLFRERGPAGTYPLLIARLQGGEATPVLDPRVNYLGARFSPDGAWLAFSSDESGTPEIYIARWPGARDKVRVSSDGGQSPRWGRDSRELFYVSSAGLMSVPMSGNRPGKAGVLVDRAKVGRWFDFDVTADGRFIATVSESVGSQQPLTVVVNWQSRLP